MPTTPHRSKVTAGHCAVVLAAAALFVALDGPSQAAGLITGKQIKNSSVTGKDIKDASLNGADVADGSLTGQDVTDGSLAGADINEGNLDKVPTATTADTAKAVAPDSINGAAVANRSLGAVDVAVANGTVNADIPNVPINDCTYALVDIDVNVAGATIVANAPDSAPFSTGGVSLHVAKSNVADSFRLVACNVTGAAIDPPALNFDYIAFR